MDIIKALIDFLTSAISLATSLVSLKAIKGNRKGKKETSPPREGYMLSITVHRKKCK